MNQTEREQKRLEVLRAFNERDRAKTAYDDACDAAVKADAELAAARITWDQSRDNVSVLLNDLFDRISAVEDDRTVLNRRKISLIKLVRVATSEYHRTNFASVPGPTCMGLREAKELVEKFIDDTRLTGL